MEGRRRVGRGEDGGEGRGVRPTHTLIKGINVIVLVSDGASTPHLVFFMHVLGGLEDLHEESRVWEVWSYVHVITHTYLIQIQSSFEVEFRVPLQYCRNYHQDLCARSVGNYYTYT